MNVINGKARLYAGAATMAVVAGWASPAAAQCVTNTSTVTCTGTVTSGDVNTAINTATPPSVTVRVDAGTTVTRTAATITPNNPPFVGAIDIGNAGTLGTAAATVGISYFGVADAATSTFTLANSGTVTGGVFVNGIGGTTSVTNTGTLAGGLFLNGSGPITVSSSGPVYVAGGGTGTTAISVNSTRSVTATTGTVGVDAVTTTTVTGGPVAVTVTGPVAIPAVGAGTATPQAISVGSQGAGGSATLSLDAVAGAVSVFASGTNSSSIPGGGNTTTAGGVTTTRTASSFTGVGGTSAATLGSAAQVASLSVTGHSGASAAIAGAVGSSTASGATTIGSNVSNSANTSETVTNATGTTTTTTSTTTPAGGAVSLDLASTGALFGSANVSSNAGAATANVAGTVGAGTGTTVTTLGNVNVTSSGTSFAQTNVNTNLLTGDFSNTQTTTRAATGKAAAATVASTGAVFGSVNATGDAGATIDNGGRIRDAAQATSSRSVTTSQTSGNSRTTTTDSAGTVTVVDSSPSTSSSQTIGGAASLTNRASGVIEDAVNVSGFAGATLNNTGAIFGNVSVRSQGLRSDGSSSFTTTTVTPATAGGAVASTVSASNSASTSAPTGGTATATYGGTIGAAPGSSLATATTITQNGQTGSVATFSGVAYADATLNSGGFRTEDSSSSTNSTVTQAYTVPATPAVETTSSSTNRNTSTVVGGNNAVTVTGALRNNGVGFGTGDLSATATGGTVTVTVDGGTVEGGIGAFSTGTNTSSGGDTSTRSTRAATTASPAAPVIAQSNTNSSFYEQRNAASTASVALTGNARVFGNVQVNGVGTGAGSTGASANIASTATLGGSLTVNAAVGNDYRSESSEVSTRTGAATVTRTSRSTYTETRPAGAGNAVATIAGNVGSASVYASHGNASATLSGRVTSSGISVSTGTSVSTSTSESTYGGTSTTSLSALTQTGFTSNSTSTATGGTAALTIASAGTTATNNLSAVEGTISVSGLGGATLAIAQGTRALATTGSIGVTSANTNSVASQTNTYNATGVQTGQSTTTTNTQVGGPASFTNAGIVGTSASSRSASVYSIGGASITNSGTFYGTLSANALGTNTRTTNVQTNINDAVLAQTVNTTSSTLVGGAASITNSAVVTGRAFLIGATGTLANTGVMRGGATLGTAGFAGTTVTTSSATSSNTQLTAATTRFQQAYTVNQNALLTGGVLVVDPTIADTSTGATATTPRLRATDIRATINLNAGSVTLGNITAAVDPITRERLTDTTLNLVGAGFLGVGYNPEAFSVGTNGDRTPRYVNTPNYASFLAIDPSLGTVDQRGDFSSSVIPFQTGSTITGVNLVEKSGAGVFTLVGNSFQSATTSTPLPTYTMDVGTLRVSGGELQLGVNGLDTITGRSTFGIRGNVVVNGGTLLLGRRVSDGTTSVVEGINLRVDGNFTQATGSTISVAATPALVRLDAVTIRPNTGAQGIFGFAEYGANLAPFVPYDPLDTNQLRSTPSTVTVNGNATLAGTISIAAQPGAIYTAGRSMDLFTVSGTYTGAGLSLTQPIVSPFVKFVLTPRTVGTQTIVSVDVARTSYATAASTGNAIAAATALDAAVPSVVSQLRAIPNPNTVTNVDAYGKVQDLATVIAALDTQVSLADATTLFTQVSSASVYGSLAAVNVTSAFGEAIDAPLGQDAGIGLWFRPTGQFGRFDGDSGTGAGALRADVYGGSFGVGVSTGNGGTFGVGGGYARTDARDRGFPSRAKADTYMVGIFGRQQFWGFDLAAQGVFGWSNWDVSRNMPLLSRKANATFDSKEFRFSARVGYDFALTGITLTPFARIDLRAYDFQGVEEENAGGLGLAVAGRKKTVVSPELGLRISGDVGGVRPFAEGSYVFQGDVGSERTVSYLGDRANSFRLRGVDPEGFGRIGAGISADLFGAGFFLRANYLTGGGNNAGEAQGGISLRF